MSYLMKYRKKGSYDEWSFYEAGNENRCTDYLIQSEFEEEMEYEIYKFSKSGSIFSPVEEEFIFKDVDSN